MANHQVAIVTVEQKDTLVGQKYNSVSYWNPVLDCNDDWIISEEEINQNIYPQFDWTQSLPLIDWCGPPLTGDTIN
jgi:hypothetical protein